MPRKDAHKQFQKWAEEYGPIYSLILGTRTMIVLSSDTAVKELLDRRSGIYSDRQDMYMAQTLCSGGMRVLIMVRHVSPKTYSVLMLYSIAIWTDVAGGETVSSKRLLLELIIHHYRFESCFMVC